MVLDYLLAQLSEGKLEEWAEMIKAKALPYLYKKKEEFLDELLEEAEKTKSPIDDMLVKKLDAFLDAFFPDNDKML
jgi:hypothetical protein